MKKLKKYFAVLLALAMVMGLNMTALAATPSETDSKTVEVSNLEAGATVTAYQIIDAEYDEDGNGFIGYVWASGTGKTGAIQFAEEGNADGYAKGDVIGLTSDFITGLAGNTASLGAPVEATAVGTVAELTLTAGTWMILVTPPEENAAKVYNPMVASVYYTVSGSDNSNMGGDGVDANADWTLVTTGAYAKSSGIDIRKTVNDDTREVGQTVDFTVDNMTIPSYSDAYITETADAVYTVTDTLVNGLEYVPSSVKVSVGGTEIQESDDTYTLTQGTGTFTVTFASAYIRGLAGESDADRAVVITYSAKVLSTAVARAAENKVTLTYSDTPGSTAQKEDTEKVFTFALDGVLQKVEEDQTTALAGAEFTLYRDADLTDVFGTYETQKADGDNKSGNIKFEGLGVHEATDPTTDEVSVYYLKETKAPTGYTINDKVYEIAFTNIVRDNAGDITGYTVTVDGEALATISYGNPAAEFGDVVVNTRLSALPSTGGIGTTIFTVGGCLIMIAAAALFFANRRKSR